MTYQELVEIAEEAGFSAWAPLDITTIELKSEVRDMCAVNSCGQYGKRWSCPPGCGSPEAMKQKILAHRKALVLQTIWEISDYSDMTLIKPAKASHNASEIRLVKRLRAEGCDGFIVGASGCALCSPCAQTLGEPCRFPEYQYSCMSAYCIHVKKLAEDCKINYDYKDNILPFFGMYIFN